MAIVNVSRRQSFMNYNIAVISGDVSDLRLLKLGRSWIQ